MDAFISPDINLSNVRTFLDAIKPLSTTFFFQVIIGEFQDEIEFKEALTQQYEMDVTPTLDGNQTTWIEQSDLDDYETIDNDALDMDSDGVLFQETTEIEVFSFTSSIDLFVV